MVLQNFQNPALYLESWKVDIAKALEAHFHTQRVLQSCGNTPFVMFKGWRLKYSHGPNGALVKQELGSQYLDQDL